MHRLPMGPSTHLQMFLLSFLIVVSRYQSSKLASDRRQRKIQIHNHNLWSLDHVEPITLNHHTGYSIIVFSQSNTQNVISFVSLLCCSLFIQIFEYSWSTIEIILSCSNSSYCGHICWNVNFL